MKGTLTDGTGDAERFIGMVESQLAAALGFTPFHGTLNLATEGTPLEEADTLLDGFGDDHCDGVRLRPCRIGGVRGAVLRPIVEGYPDETVEIVAPVRLRSLFGIDTGDTVPVSFDDTVWPASALPASPAALSSFDAVVFDLDNTLVTLDVDWEAVFEDIQTVIDPLTETPVRSFTKTELYALARTHGRYDEVERVLREAELAGVDGATALPALETLQELDCPVGVCTANALEGAERALDRFGAGGAVDAIVGRTTVERQKPDAEPLLECLARLDVKPGDGVFVGDGEPDAGAAVDATTSYLHPSQLWPTAEPQIE